MLSKQSINLISNEIVSTSVLIKVLTLRNFSENNFEITPEQFVILDTVFKNKSIYQRQIGEIIGKDRANVARLINILFEKKLIEKNVDSNGRQINRITLTENGLKLRNKILPIIEKIRKSYLENISQEELNQCYNIINKIKKNIAENTKLKT